MIYIGSDISCGTKPNIKFVEHDVDIALDNFINSSMLYFEGWLFDFKAMMIDEFEGLYTITCFRDDFYNECNNIMFKIKDKYCNAILVRDC